MAVILNYENNCWWCGNKADSSEHKYKKTDLTQEFGRGRYSGKNAIVKNVGGLQKYIQGPKSQEVKFDKNMCGKCNNQKSQVFDISYEKFTSYIQSNEETILKNRCFIFSDIYGEFWEKHRLNLLRYYVKHICCRFASSNISISSNTIDFLNGSESLKYFIFHLEIRDDIVVMIEQLKRNKIGDGCLWIGGLYALKDEQGGIVDEIESFLGYRWLRLNYFYDSKVNTSSDNFTQNVVTLPSGYNVGSPAKSEKS